MKTNQTLVTWYRTMGVLMLVLCTASCMGTRAPIPPVMPAPPIEIVPEVPTGSLFGARSGPGLFEDRRAKRVGDILTVRLMEETDAANTSGTSISKSNSNDIQNPVIAGEALSSSTNLQFTMDSGHEFSGSADSNQSNSLEGTIAVLVTAVLPGGNLMVEGEKWITLNRGREFIRLSGIVRPIDIGQDNIVASNRIANANIAYSATGDKARANTVGWLSRFFMGRYAPF